MFTGAGKQAVARARVVIAHLRLWQPESATALLGPRLGRPSPPAVSDRVGVAGRRRQRRRS